jgi:hypothetical protein
MPGKPLAHWQKVLQDFAHAFLVRFLLSLNIHQAFSDREPL